VPTPSDLERREAQAAAEEALERAERVSKRAKSIAEGWRQSREDNNYRAMLRKLVGTGVNDG